MSASAAIEPFTQAELDAFASRWNRSRVLRYLGIRMAFADARVIVDLPEVLPGQRGGKGGDAINGGVLAALFDFALGATAMLAPPMRRNATMHLSLDFLRAARGSSARCIATVDRATRNALFSSAELLDERGEVCARGTALVSLGAPISLAEWSATLDDL